jgi:hypothetical protein
VSSAWVDRAKTQFALLYPEKAEDTTGSPPLWPLQRSILRTLHDLYQEQLAEILSLGAHDAFQSVGWQKLIELLHGGVSWDLFRDQLQHPAPALSRALAALEKRRLLLRLKPRGLRARNGARPGSVRFSPKGWSVARGLLEVASNRA